MENIEQKISKLSVSSSEYASDCSSNESLVEYERTPQLSVSSNKPNTELLRILSLTLSQREFAHDSSDISFSNIKTLTSTLCTEFLKITQPSPQIDSAEHVIDKILNTGQCLVTLNNRERKMILGVLVNLLGESTQSRINSKIKNLQISVINSGKTIKRLREDLKHKNSLIDSLQTKTPRPSQISQK